MSASIGTLAAYKRAHKALERAREAIEATGIDLDLIEAFHDAAQEEAMAMLTCDLFNPDKPAATYAKEQAEKRYKAALAGNGSLTAPAE